MNSLQELTGHESGAVLYSDGTIWIGNWTSISGIPRMFGYGPYETSIGLGEDLSAAKRCKAPDEVKKAMRQHDKAQTGLTSPRTGFRAWTVADVVVVIQGDWA